VAVTKRRPSPGKIEYLLDNDISPDQERYLHADDGDYRYQGIFQGVPHDDNALPEPLRPSRSDIVLPQYFQHHGYGIIYEMMPYHDAGSIEAGLCQNGLGEGAQERVVVMRHALKNALIPVITIIGMQVSFLIGGDVIIEQIFNLPGLGRLLVTATQQRDYPIVQGVLLFFALAMVLINLLVDLTYGFFDRGSVINKDKLLIRINRVAENSPERKAEKKRRSLFVDALIRLVKEQPLGTAVGLLPSSCL